MGLFRDVATDFAPASTAALKDGNTGLSDTSDLKRTPLGFVCNSAGALSVLGKSQESDAAPVTLSVAAGQVYPLAVRRIRATTTTVPATDIILLYGQY